MIRLRSTLPLLVILLNTGCASLSGDRHAQQPYNSGQDADGVRIARQHNRSTDGSSPADATEAFAAPTDFWDQMRQGFTLGGTRQARVARQIDAYSQHPDQIEKIFQRATPYMAYIRAEVEQRGYPLDIALLPFIESGYDPFAYSRGQAAGLWQFIPGTGRLYGLQQNWWYDGRRDIVASTRAALDHLGTLHDQFDGDWLLALAAYNAGGGTVRSAIERNLAAGRPADYWHLELPQETMDYVPRLLAIREIVRNPDQYQVSLASIDTSPAFTMVNVDGQIDLGVAARLAGMDTSEFLHLNPGFNRLSTHPDKPQRLAIPVEKVDSFVERLGNLPESERTRVVQHTVAKGETLSQIAARHKVSISTLQTANHLQGSLIKPGQSLVVSSTSAAPNMLAIAPQQRVLARAAATTHTVRNGESLWAIARKYDISVGQLRSWNKLGSRDVIRPGLQLRIEQPGSSMLARTERQRVIRHTVRSGDSLYSIAKRYDVSINDLRSWNNLPNNNLLKTGQTLEIRIRLADLARR